MHGQVTHTDVAMTTVYIYTCGWIQAGDLEKTANTESVPDVCRYTVLSDVIHSNLSELLFTSDCPPHVRNCSPWRGFTDRLLPLSAVHPPESWKHKIVSCVQRLPASHSDTHCIQIAPPKRNWTNRILEGKSFLFIYFFFFCYSSASL